MEEYYWKYYFPESCWRVSQKEGTWETGIDAVVMCALWKKKFAQWIWKWDARHKKKPDNWYATLMEFLSFKRRFWNSQKCESQRSSLPRSKLELSNSFSQGSEATGLLYFDMCYCTRILFACHIKSASTSKSSIVYSSTGSVSNLLENFRNNKCWLLVDVNVPMNGPKLRFAVNQGTFKGAVDCVFSKNREFFPFCGCCYKPSSLWPSTDF